MSVDIGTRLGSLEIMALLGKGGMGEVYRARDTKLKREVAIKFLPDEFSRDPSRVSRFQREAEVLASLNHPNIAAIYDVQEAGERRFLVLELVEGETLAERIQRGPIPVEEALDIATHMCEALEAAHEKGIVHRDLKPANVKITPEGKVKVLDFGLAKAGGLPTAASDNSPTLSLHETEAGVVLGTAAYMSPEQAKGKPADARVDVWAFGVVLYEMLTGKPLYHDETVTETIAAVLKEPPDLTRVPIRVRRLMRSCLQKDAQDRLHHIGDWKLLLDDSEAEAPAAPPTRSRWLWPAVAALVLLAATLLAFQFLRKPVPVQEVRTQIPQPEGLTFTFGTQAVISPDARWLAFQAFGPDNVSRYYLRALDSLEIRPLPGSEGIIGIAPPPFWSYDSRFVVYGALDKLKKSEITGTPAQAIANTGQPFLQGGAWSRDGVILYANPSGTLMQVPETGGTPVAVTAMAPRENAHRWPQFLPDGRRFLYLRVSSSPDKTGVYVGSLDRKPEEQNMQPLLLTDRQAWWVASEASGKSYLLFQREGTLLTQPFNTATLALSGTPVQVANDVGALPSATAGYWSMARNGTLVYRVGGSGLPQLAWRDLRGNTVGIVAEPNAYANIALSPDGTKVAFRLTDSSGNADIWVRDIARGSNIRVTFDPRRDDFPVWSPDSTRIIFASDRSGKLDLYEKNINNSSEERLLWKSDQDKAPTSWSRDGRFLLFDSVDPQTRNDLWVLPLDGTSKPCPFLKTQLQEQQAQFSPDGRWIVYTALQSANPQIYARRFSPDSACATSGSGSQWMVSTAGGAFPQWRNDGNQLFYLTLNADLMAVDVQPAASFQQNGAPRRLFAITFAGGMSRYSVARSGDRFLLVQIPASAGPPPPFTIVQNWLAALER